MTEERLSSAKHQISNGEREIGKVEILGKIKKKIWRNSKGKLMWPRSRV